MKTQAEKALEACKEYDRLMTEIAMNTRTISDGLSYCTRMVSQPGYFAQALPDGVKSHVGEVFSGFIAGEFEPEHHYYSEKAAIAIIGDCAGCLRAYKAVQERKANKKALGSVKRKIRMIARAA